jgi:hypothetical protein
MGTGFSIGLHVEPLRSIGDVAEITIVHAIIGI